VLDPLIVVLVNYPDGQRRLDVVNTRGPRRRTRNGAVRPRAVHRADDFREDPPPKFFRLAPGREVRLRNAYLTNAWRW